MPNSKNKIIKAKLRSFFTRRLKDLIIKKETTTEQNAFEFSRDLINKNDDIDALINLLVASIEDVRMSKENMTALTEKPEKYLSVLSDLAEKLFQNIGEELDASSFSYTITPEAETKIKRLIDEKLQQLFGEQDLRMHVNSNREVRRMDSLARIFSLKNSLSVCSAVFYHRGKLLISANLASEDKRKEVIAAFQQRFILLRRFIQNTKEIDKYNKAELIKVAEAFLDELSMAGQTSVKQETLTNAMLKFSHAVHHGGNCLEHGMRELFTTAQDHRYKILLPAFTAQKELALIVTTHNGETKEYLISQKPGSKTQLKDIHAEQLIAKYVFKVKAKEPDAIPFKVDDVEQPPLGVSKLCCLTCWTNLSDLPIQLRGTHNQSYHNVHSLFENSDKIPSPISSRVITHAESSLSDSIFNKEESAEEQKPIFRTPTKKQEQHSDDAPDKHCQSAPAKIQSDRFAGIRSNVSRTLFADDPDKKGDTKPLIHSPERKGGSPVNPYGCNRFKRTAFFLKPEDELKASSVAGLSMDAN